MKQQFNPRWKCSGLALIFVAAFAVTAGAGDRGEHPGGARVDSFYREILLHHDDGHRVKIKCTSARCNAYEDGAMFATKVYGPNDLNEIVKEYFAKGYYLPRE
ncbi:MAG: hypothetical protein KDJ16_03440 [Hyphomicrobiales bacterium]|nr:hypothetical protein [Hyphomicrobiales bacterium]